MILSRAVNRYRAFHDEGCQLLPLCCSFALDVADFSFQECIALSFALSAHPVIQFVKQGLLQSRLLFVFVTITIRAHALLIIIGSLIGISTQKRICVWMRHIPNVRGQQPFFHPFPACFIARVSQYFLVHKHDVRPQATLHWVFFSLCDVIPGIEQERLVDRCPVPDGPFHELGNTLQGLCRLLHHVFRFLHFVVNRGRNVFQVVAVRV
mmetsp:Transcript_58897/g.97439  ORF Transcript_58897/g.97439 Transcript_58897/m.97439 type:complete len:209 (-) Transcript_58897:21-647(-)